MATHDVDSFVQALKDFHGTLPPAQQAMLETILNAAQQASDTTGYGYKWPRTEPDQPPQLGDETVGYGRGLPRTEEAQPGDETAGYGKRLARTEEAQPGDETSGYGRYNRQEGGQTTSQGPVTGRYNYKEGDEGWQKLAAWLSSADETAGYGWKNP